jgi:hypothetical protein
LIGVRCFWLEKVGDRWKRADTGQEFESPHLAGEGALYDAPWIRGTNWRGTLEQDLLKAYPDGLTVVVITPGGPWVIDGPSYDGTAHHPCPWTRTGDPRSPSTFSVSPSINQTGSYHGWLRDGELVPA